MQKHQSDEEVIAQLNLQPGQTVYALLRHVARSGMSRVLDFYAIEDGRMIRITPWLARLLALNYEDRFEGIRVRGAGFDPAQHILGMASIRLFGQSGKLDPADRLECAWL